MIALMGMKGVGKTTYATLLAEQLASNVVNQDIDDSLNQLSTPLDSEPRKFPLEVYHLNKRLEIAKKAIAYERLIVDQTIQEDILRAQVSKDLGYMTKDEKLIYDHLQRSFSKMVQSYSHDNDLYLYLKADFPTIISRIKQTDPSIESNAAQLEYYRTLHLRYEDWVKANVPPAQLLTIDTNQFDIYREDHKAQIFQLIQLKMQALGL